VPRAASLPVPRLSGFKDSHGNPSFGESPSNGEANNAATDHDDIINIYLNGPTEGRDVVV
jgi:hypothetical protein